jgi:L-fucose isomerase-like protein
MERRDIFQRKAYAIHRMALAAHRLIQMTSIADREKAKRWIAMWSAVSGLRQYKLGNGGGRSQKRSSHAKPFFNDS